MRGSSLASCQTRTRSTSSLHGAASYLGAGAAGLVAKNGWAWPLAEAGARVQPDQARALEYAQVRRISNLVVRVCQIWQAFLN